MYFDFDRVCLTDKKTSEYGSLYDGIYVYICGSKRN
jgi:hypothetical protein